MTYDQWKCRFKSHILQKIQDDLYATLLNMGLSQNEAICEVLPPFFMFPLLSLIVVFVFYAICLLLH